VLRELGVIAYPVSYDEALLEDRDGRYLINSNQLFRRAFNIEWVYRSDDWRTGSSQKKYSIDDIDLALADLRRD